MIPRNLLLAIALAGSWTSVSGGAHAGEKVVWKPVEFAIVRYNDDAPASWNMYHGEKKGLLLLRLWRRYLLVNVQEQEVYELDPDKVKLQGENVEWSPSDLPDRSDRNVGMENTGCGTDAAREIQIWEDREFLGYSVAVVD